MSGISGILIFMRASRLLSILILLQVRGRLTAKALAEEFEVSVRTIYRDVDELSAAGVPVYADRGPGGGFQLLDGYRTRLTGLTSSEAEALLLAGLPEAAADLGLGEPLAAGRLKLLAALPAAAGEGAVRVGDRFHLDPIDWYRRAPVLPHLPTIARAVWSGTRLMIRYEKSSGAVRRTLEPLGLVMKAGAWYLVARIDDAIRTYKVARVLEVEALDERFDYPPAFDLAAHWRESLHQFEAARRRGEARLRVSPRAMSRIYCLGADIAEAVMAVDPDFDGWREAKVPIETIEDAAFLLAGFGDSIEVVEPFELRRALADHARRLLVLYPEPQPTPM
jgi:predicted DNA-binding transcriptional regulator YafY